ncbi:hypothetical protein [Cypionkella psychrotolerans]|uniref:hypothetical protein n=1 Tax=Cypionkella psychrotolerans TaxID=1678131 RepID=UPI0006B5C2E1|nr:hypothetical protein [Cypionkella psychrotolerans]
MSDLQRLSFLKGQISELEILIDEAALSGNTVGRLNYATRLEVVTEELDALLLKDTLVGEIAILFDGPPVTGTRAIDASFAALALTYFQGIVTRLYSASLGGQLNARGKIRGSRLAGLNIRAVATGSFGFILEESEPRQASMIKTPIRETLEAATALLSEFAQEDDDNFLIDVDEIDPRVFIALSKFFRHLELNDATLKTNLPDKLYSFGRADIERAYKRISNTHVKIEPVSWTGRLVGLSPIKRSFDFKRDGGEAIVTGKFSHQVSQDYLERIENADGITLGHRFVAAIEIGTIRKPDGSTSVSYTVTDLVEISE